VDKLSTGDKLILGGGIAYLICMFLPWYGIDGGGSNSGWDYFLGGWIPLILIGVMVAHVGVTTFTETALPEPPVPWNQVHRGLGVAAAVIVLLRLIIGSDIDVPFVGDISLDREIGLFLALIAAIVVAAGGFTRDDTGAAPTTSGGDTGSAPF
jgi:hypothetical protein